MTKHKLQNLFIGIFLTGALGLLVWFNVSKPSILVLQSYDSKYPWSRDLNVGLNRVLNSPYLYRTRWYYMDTKKHPDVSYKESVGLAARHMINDMQPDVIIAVDDDAQQFVARYYVNDPHIKIVFTGVNREAADYGYDKANNVTGILERVPTKAIQEMLQMATNFRALDRPVRLGFIADPSETVQADLRQVKTYDWGPVQFTAESTSDTFPKWKDEIKRMNKETDIILLSNYRKVRRSDTDKTLVPVREIVEWTDANSTVPVMSNNGFYTEEGGMLAIGASPFEQGEVAARMALSIILKGKKPKDIPVDRTRHFVVTMNGTKMKAHGLELPMVYEAAARTGDKYIP
jgi:ABC-type uncharacterized transport system substrate-binding protein